MILVTITPTDPGYRELLQYMRTRGISYTEKPDKPNGQKLVCFELTMPNRGSWNGQWTGQDRKYYVIKKISSRYLKSKEHFKTLLDKGKDSFYYSWDDGWGANVIVEMIDGTESRKRRQISAGFSGYDWMIESIIMNGVIMTTTERKQKVETVF